MCDPDVEFGRPLGRRVLTQDPFPQPSTRVRDVVLFLIQTSLVQKGIVGLD